MKITLLGTGTCSNIPNISGRKPPGFLAEWGGNQVLFDCSEGVRWRLEQAGYDISTISHIAISHTHPDHYNLVQYHQSVSNRWAWGGDRYRREELRVYAPRWACDNYEQLWSLHSPDFPVSQLPTKLRFIPMPEAGPVTIGDATLSAARVHHGWGNVESLAYRLETPEGIFAYSGDTGDCEGIRDICRGADVFICEASARIGDRDTPHSYGHLSPEVAGAISAAGGVRTLVLFHHTGLDADADMLTAVRRGGFQANAIVGQDGEAISA